MTHKLTIAGLLIAVLSALSVGTSSAAAPAPPNGPVLVIPFSPRTDAAPGWVGQSIAGNLRDELERSSVHVIRADVVAAPDPLAVTDHAINQARAAGARTVIFGTYQLLGWELSVDGQIVDVATGQVLSELHASNALRDRIAVESDLTTQMRQALALAPGAQPAPAVAQHPAPAQQQIPFDDQQPATEPAQPAVETVYVPQTVYYPVYPAETIVYPSYGYYDGYYTSFSFSYGYPRYHCYSRYYYPYRHCGYYGYRKPYWYGYHGGYYSRWDYRSDRKDWYDDDRNTGGHRGDRFRGSEVTRNHSGKERDRGAAYASASRFDGYRAETRAETREDWRKVYPRSATSARTSSDDRIAIIDSDGKRTRGDSGSRGDSRDDSQGERFRDGRIARGPGDADRSDDSSETRSGADRARRTGDGSEKARDDAREKNPPSEVKTPRDSARDNDRPRGSEPRAEPRPESKPRPAPRGDDSRPAPPPRRADPAPERPSRGREVAPPSRSEPPARSRGDSGASRGDSGGSRGDSGASRGGSSGGSREGGSFRGGGGGGGGSSGGGGSRGGRGR